jgi:hypothetical protein
MGGWSVFNDRDIQRAGLSDHVRGQKDTPMPLRNADKAEESGDAKREGRAEVTGKRESFSRLLRHMPSADMPR